MLKLKSKIMISELLTTDALINSIRVLFILRIIQETDFIGFLNTFMLSSIFILEIPAGFFGDKYGNRMLVVISKLTFLLSVLFLIIGSHKIFFILSFVLLGTYSALESGAKNSYFLELYENDDEEYKKVRVIIEKGKYIISFVFSVISSILFYWNEYVPFIITMILGMISLLLILSLPKESITTKSSNSLISSTKDIIKDVLANRTFFTRISIFTILSTITVFTFYYYNFFFEQNGIPDYIFGIIYSTFSLMGLIGVKIYKNKRAKSFVKLLLPLSFIFVICDNIFLLGCAVIIQEVLFSFISIEFELMLVTEMNGRDDSSQFQSTISFFYSLIRIIITAVLSTLISINGIEFAFAIITISSILIIFYQYNYFKGQLSENEN